MSHLLSVPAAAALANLSLSGDRPVIVCDADEVLVKFIAGLEAYLARRGFHLDVSSLAIHGNVRHGPEGDVVARDQVTELMQAFFAEGTETLEPVPGAAEALVGLSAHAEIVILSNVPASDADKRTRNLCRHGMDYPLIPNEGVKGPALAAIAARAHGQPIFFIDDLPHNLKSAAEHAAHSTRLHYMADPRLSRLMPTSAHAHYRPHDWHDAARFIREHLAGA